MSNLISERLEKFLEENKQFHYDMTCELGKIASPSNHEEKRARWIKKYFDSYGGTQSYIDSHTLC